MDDDLFSNRVVAIERISDEGEDLSNQQYALFKTLREKGWKLVREPIQVVQSGKHGLTFEGGDVEEERSHINMIKRMAKAHEFDILWVYHHDRLTRQGGAALVVYVQLFASMGVRIFDYQDNKFIDVPKKALDELNVEIKGFSARAYREDVADKTQNALDKIKDVIKTQGYYVSKSGKRISHLGNQEKDLDVNLIVELRRKGFSFRAIGQQLGAGAATIKRRYDEAQKRR